jgi:hypothetical protein
MLALHACDHGRSPHLQETRCACRTSPLTSCGHLNCLQKSCPLTTHLLVNVADVHRALYIVLQPSLHLLTALLLPWPLPLLAGPWPLLFLQVTPTAPKAPAPASITWAHTRALLVVVPGAPIRPAAVQHLMWVPRHALRPHMLLMHHLLLLASQARCWRSIAIAICTWGRASLLRTAIVLTLAWAPHHLLLWVEHEVALNALSQVCHALLLSTLPVICWGQSSSVICRNGCSRQPVRHIGHRYCRGHPAHAVSWGIVFWHKGATQIALLLLVATAALVELRHARAAALYY